MSETNVNVGESRARRATRKPKKSQIPYGVLALLIYIVIGVLLAMKSPNLALYWIIGICFGFILQRSRFCFTAAMRDPYLTGSTSVTRAVLIAFALTSIAFTAIKYGYHIKGLPIPGQSYVVPISLATVVGAFMFGVGMVIAGGCASGTLMRVGEGFGMQILSLVFFILGSLWGAHDFGWWKYNFIITGKAIFLPDYLGWFGGLACNLLIIAVLYVVATKWQNKKNKSE